MFTYSLMLQGVDNTYFTGYYVLMHGGVNVKKRLTVNIDEKLIEPLKIDAVKKTISVGEIVEKLIADYLEAEIINDVVSG